VSTTAHLLMSCTAPRRGTQRGSAVVEGLILREARTGRGRQWTVGGVFLGRDEAASHNRGYSFCGTCRVEDLQMDHGTGPGCKFKLNFECAATSASWCKSA
jgi:hypothetical protein